MGWLFKSEEQKWAEAKLDPERNARARHKGFTNNQLVQRQDAVEQAKGRKGGKRK